MTDELRPRYRRYTPKIRRSRTVDLGLFSRFCRKGEGVCYDQDTVSISFLYILCYKLIVLPVIYRIRADMANRIRLNSYRLLSATGS